MRRIVAGLTVVVATVALTAGVPSTVRIPSVVPRDGEPGPGALFSHVAHRRMQCYACHPGIFPQRVIGFTHDDMRAGRFCGACHNGRVTFSPDDVSCETCHRKE